MLKIKFGTDGWRAIIAKDYTVDNLCRVAEATANWLKKEKDATSVVVGYDCRFGGKMFAEITACKFCEAGLQVSLSPGFVSTPMVSLGTKKLGADQGIIITASHNPPEYNGYKLKGEYGGPTLPEDIAKVESMIGEEINLPEYDVAYWESKGRLEYVDLEDMYVKHVEEHFDLDAIRNSGLKLAYDAMFGAGQNAIRRILPNAELLHCEFNPSFLGTAPEPLHRNLEELSNLISSDNSIDCGLATDGDADRIGMYDADGNFVDAHHIILLLIKYLKEEKNMDGKVVVAFSVTEKIKKLCATYDLELVITKIGFKHICGHMIKDDVLLGGEESGGIAIKGHIPERDGIWDGLTIMEMMARSGKSLKELIADIYALVGSFDYERNDLKLDESKKLEVIEKCKAGEFSSFGDYQVEKVEDIDGFKFHLGNDSWVMIRPSGTEPVLRVYAEAPDINAVRDILEATKKTILA